MCHTNSLEKNDIYHLLCAIGALDFLTEMSALCDKSLGC